MDPLVTIAIPTYNRANGYLPGAIKAALDQTYQQIEVLVSDNCSKDNTEEVVRSFDDPRVVYLRQKENVGHNGNFNACLKHAKGDYFLLLPDDDLIDPDFVETCIERCGGRTDIGMIQTGTRTIDAEGRTLYEAPNRGTGSSAADYANAWFGCKKHIYLCGTLFVTEHLREIGGFESKHNLCQDMKADFELAARFGWVDVEEVKASIRRHGEEITFTSKIQNSCEDALMLLDLACELVPEGERLAIRRQGLWFLGRANYNRARHVKGLGRKLRAYVVVFRMFGNRVLPPLDHFCSPGWGIRKWLRSRGLMGRKGGERRASKNHNAAPT